MMERLKESRWLYILVSVLIAVAFWLYIRNVQNTASDYTIYNVPVQITNSRVLNERGLTVASLSQDTVNVTVNAPWSVQRNLNRNNIVATVDVSTITEAGSYELACTPRLFSQSQHQLAAARKPPLAWMRWKLLTSFTI